MISNEGTYTEKQLSVMSLTSQWLGFISSVSLVALFAYFSRRGKNFWNTGCAVLSLVLAFIFFDSAKFNTGEVGVADSSFLQSVVPDVKCESGMVVFKYVKEGDSEWRCPKRLAMLQDTGKMFIPWPDYHGQKSNKLTIGINALQNQLTRQVQEDERKLKDH